MKLTEKQINLLEDVINYAIHFIKEASKGCVVTVKWDNGKFEKFKKEEKIKQICDLGDYIKPFIEIVDKE